MGWDALEGLDGAMEEVVAAFGLTNAPHQTQSGRL